jgi:hypothetical protein
MNQAELRSGFGSKKLLGSMPGIPVNAKHVGVRPGLPKADQLLVLRVGIEVLGVLQARELNDHRPIDLRATYALKHSGSLTVMLAMRYAGIDLSSDT